MAKNKEVSVSVDVDELSKQLEQRRLDDDIPDEEQGFSVRSTVFSLGNDPRVFSKQPVAAPDLFMLEIMKDGLDNPYIKLNWKVKRSEIDSGRIIGFNVFRRKLNDEDAVSFRGVFSYSRNAFERLARGNKNVGKFSAHKKAIYNIKRGSIPPDILNNNLYEIQKSEEVRKFQDLDEDFPSYTQADFERYMTKRNFEKISYVEYSKFIAEEKKKFLVVKDRNFVELNYKDKKVGYLETFDYYVQAVTKELEDVPRSNVVRVTIEDTSSVAPPKSVIAKQISDREIQLSICLESADKIDKVSVYRRSEEEISFDQLIETENTNDCVNIVDGDARYSKTYTYRVFSENIHGSVSEPKEITVFSSVQKITPQSRSNVLKIPIISAVQDQNSDFIRVTISPNDPSVLYYELKRRDLSIFEKKFSVPSKLETNYGGDGWISDKFFVNKSRVPTSQTSKEDTSTLKTKTVLEEIVFVDDLITPDHIYQYRTRGYDLFGNPTSYAFSVVKSTGKKSLRTPINIKSELLRGYPFRTKISWDDDNLTNLVPTEELFEGKSSIDKEENKILYRIQRRRLGENIYETFPLTANKFIIDEVSAVDAVTFDGHRIQDTFFSGSNVDPSNESLRVKDEIRRAFKMPNFLTENNVYFYRMAAVAKDGEESNISEEFQITTIADLSDPLNFGVEVANAKVRPVVVRVFWENDPQKSIPDYWTIERRADSPYESFALIGKAYLEMQFFDVNVNLGNTYIYRIKAFDAIGRESQYFEERITL